MDPLQIKSVQKLPKDKFRLILLMFFINGIGTLIPWNMMITADKYFVEYKLANADQSYRILFLTYLGIASKAPNILLQILNMFSNHSNQVNLSARIRFTLIVQILVFIFTIILACIDSSEWPTIFFWLTILSAVIINIVNGIYQGCIYGLAARFPMNYTNSVTMGMNFSGTIASLLMIVSIAISPDLKTQAILFFLSALIILVVCLVGEYFVTNNIFYQYYTFGDSLMQINNNGCEICFEKGDYHQKNQCTHLGFEIAKTIRYDQMLPDGMKSTTVSKEKLNQFDDENDNLSLIDRYCYLIRSIWYLLFNIILIYAVSLSLFPAVQARIISIDHLLPDSYFSPVFCFLSFNLFATIGNFIAQWIQWPGPKRLWIISTLRLLFIPYFLYCNYYPDGSHRTVPVLFERDWHFVLGSILMATTSGYLSSLCMMYAPKCVRRHHSTIAGMMSALTIILGILIGMNISLLYPLFVLH
ncbi:protein-lysine N-methyltransferase METTL10 [Sarcoptes scabiei]|nr:protein-lysine N-methyltransferase METTL10 [Sarcoptes scabiei]